MPARPTWKGFLKVSLVTIPVRVYPATESSATISFNQLHEECQTRIQQKKWCPHCEREVTSAEVVKGYEFEKGRWVVVPDEDIAKVKAESTKVINLVQFADDDEIDPMYVDKAYYLAPEGATAADAYAVMRDGMAGKAGIGKVAIHGREYLVAVKPHKQGLVMYTLHHAAEIRTIDQIDELREVRGKVTPAEAKLAQQVIESYQGPLDLTSYTDEYQSSLRAIIDAKVAGEEIVAPKEEAAPKVIDLMEALRRSLDQVSSGRKPTAKVEDAKTTAPARKAAAKAPKLVAAKPPARKRKAS
jgi:DNA end-binding protein Ku